MKKVIILVSIFLIGCGPNSDPLKNIMGSYRNYVSVNGKVKNNRYYHPYDKFSIEIPSLVTPGRVIDGHFYKNYGTVGFRDDFGKIVRVDLISAKNDKEKDVMVGDNWKILLPNNRLYFLNLYKGTRPNSKILYQKYIDWNGKKVDFFITDIKDKHDKTLLRGSFSFIYDNSFFTISLQYGILNSEGRNNLKKAIKPMLSDLKGIANTVEFTIND